MRAYGVTVWDTDRRWTRRHYVVALTKKSAMEQAKWAAGYPAEECTNRSGIVDVIILARF